LQAAGRGAAAHRAVAQELRVPADRAGQQYRPLPAGGAAARHHPIDPRSPARVPPSGDDRHQVGPGDPRYRHPCRDGAGAAGHGRGVGDDARPRAGAAHGAALAAAGIPAGVMAAPMIPALNDSEMEAILERGRAAGAVSAAYTMLRLPLELKALFREWLERHEPGRAAHVLSLVAQAHGGRLYDSRWSSRMIGSGPYAAMLAARFDRACRRLGFQPRSERLLDTGRFRPPP